MGKNQWARILCALSDQHARQMQKINLGEQSNQARAQVLGLVKDLKIN